jgi:hypothetical protein
MQSLFAGRKINLIHHRFVRISETQSTNDRECRTQQNVQSIKKDLILNVHYSTPDLIILHRVPEHEGCEWLTSECPCDKVPSSLHRTMMPFVSLHHVAILPSCPCLQWKTVHLIEHEPHDMLLTQRHHTACKILQ